jgi:hypothetical protein
MRIPLMDEHATALVSIHDLERHEGVTTPDTKQNLLNFTQFFTTFLPTLKKWLRF